MTNSFNVGDMVRLKSGGPMMRVTQFRKDKSGFLKVECAWYEGPMEVEELFPPAILDLMRPARGQSESLPLPNAS